jgi:hypothetical protein
MKKLLIITTLLFIGNIGFTSALDEVIEKARKDDEAASAMVRESREMGQWSISDDDPMNNCVDTGDEEENATHDTSKCKEILLQQNIDEYDDLFRKVVDILNNKEIPIFEEHKNNKQFFLLNSKIISNIDILDMAESLYLTDKNGILEDQDEKHLIKEHYTPNIKAINALIKKLDKAEKLVKANREFLYTVDSHLYNIYLDLISYGRGALERLKHIRY